MPTRHLAKAFADAGFVGDTPGRESCPQGWCSSVGAVMACCARPVTL